MELPGTTPHDRALIAVEKIRISQARVKIAQLLQSQLPTGKIGLPTKKSRLMKKTPEELISKINAHLDNPRWLETRAVHWTHICSESALATLVIEELCPSFGSKVQPEAHEGAMEDAMKKPR